MNKWYYVTAREAEQGVQVAILEVPGDQELERVILIEDAGQADSFEDLKTVLVRNIKDPKEVKRFYTSGYNDLWFEFCSNPMTEELCLVTHGPNRRFGFIAQI